MPEGDVFLKLEGIIARLSEEYSSPLFPPHVTLVGQVKGPVHKVLSDTKELAFLMAPYEIVLADVDFLDSYFKSLFVRCRETEEVMAANSLAREIFGRKDDPPYMPHLSLAYGDFSVDEKKRMITKTGGSFNMKFTADALHLYSTEGAPHQWKMVESFSLGAKI